MLDDVKTAYGKTKQFVKKHPTATACALTAVVSWRMSHNHTLNALGEDVAGVVEKWAGLKSELDSVVDLSYQWGQKAGQLEVLLDEAYNFIKEQGLESEFVDFANIPVLVDTLR